MNQSIQILDGYQYDDVSGAMTILAMCDGLLVSCSVEGMAADQAAHIYSAHQFDIENYLEQLLSETDWEVSGEVSINASDLTQQLGS